MIKINTFKENKLNLIFNLCWIVYFTSYLGRYNFSAVMPVLIDENIITAVQAGSINMIYFVLYGIGQIINGFFGDQISSKKMITIGLISTTLCNLAFTLINSYSLMLIIWGINGFAQSILWPPIIKIFSTQFTPSEQKEAGIKIASSSSFGIIGSFILAAISIHFLNWRFVFIIPSIILITIMFLWNIKYIPLNVEKKSTSQKKLVINSKFILLITIIGIPILIHGILKDGVASWIPTYFFSVFKTSPSFSIILSLSVPICNLIGMFLTSYLNRIFKEKEFFSITILYSLLSIIIFGFYKFGVNNIVISCVCFSLIAILIMSLNIIFINLIPLYFKGKVSFISGIFNSITYIGSGFASLLIGILIVKWNWEITILSWTILSLLALLFCLILQKKDLKFV